MLDILRKISHSRVNKTPENFKSGDTVTVYVKVKEGEKERLQAYEGTVIKIQGSGIGRSFTVRKISNGVGVERCFPFSSPIVERVELVSRGKVRRSRLYYLRGLKGKKARISSELVTAPSQKGKVAEASEAPQENIADQASEQTQQES